MGCVFCHSFASPFQIFYNSDNSHFLDQKFDSVSQDEGFIILCRAFLMSVLNTANFEFKIVFTGLILHQKKDLGLFSIEENDFRSFLTISLYAK